MKPKIVETYVLWREDMINPTNVDINLLEATDFKTEYYKDMITHDLVVFVDNDGKTKIIKNRYGNIGIVKSSKKRK